MTRFVCGVVFKIIHPNIMFLNDYIYIIKLLNIRKKN